MEANRIPLNNGGNTGVSNLMAEQPSTPSGMTPREGHRGADDVTKVMRLMAEAEARDTFLAGRPLYTRYAPGLSSEAGHAITRSGFWSGVGFVGASTFAAGLLLLVDGGATAGIALSLILAGGAVATFSWRSAWQILEGIDRGAPDGANAASPAGSVCGSGPSTVALRLAPAHPRTTLGAR